MLSRFAAVPWQVTPARKKRQLKKSVCVFVCVIERDRQKEREKVRVRDR